MAAIVNVLLAQVSCISYSTCTSDCASLTGAVGTIHAWTCLAQIHLCAANSTIKPFGTDAVEVIQEINTCSAIETRHWDALVNVNFTVDPRVASRTDTSVTKMAVNAGCSITARPSSTLVHA